MEDELLEKEIVEESVVYDEIELLDVYDNYYLQQILSSLDEVKQNQASIIENQLIEIACHQQHNTSFNVICVLLGITVCYIVIRDMLHL